MAMVHIHQSHMQVPQQLRCSRISPLAFNVGLAYVLVYCIVLGFKGQHYQFLAIIVDLVIMLGLCELLRSSRIHGKDFSMECFKHVLPSTKLAIPSAVMVRYVTL
ncbi:hypothetical protein IFM89_000448 [Coptis chinensis]|uniref:Uncharacterized protein n=1 Tax=Coptis chinensis TaxID=261450 RepID=A0A835I785_9MAGN|nr:hypothetical protein IFM89_000448 [Coptis chinensis]